MKLLLSCFGIGCDSSSVWDVYSKSGYRDYDDWPDQALSFFFSMPAISLQTVGPGFIPDYPVFLLFDEFVIDQTTYSLLSEQKHWGYKEYGDLVQTLYQAGRLKIESYESLLEPYKDVVREATEYDLGMLRSWYPEFRELTSRWREFADLATREIFQRNPTLKFSAEEKAILRCLQDSRLGMIPTPDGLHILNALKSWSKALDPYIRERTRLITGEYFRYVTSNILLSELTGATVHEWFDLEPLYLKKLSVGSHPKPDTISEIKQARKLFEVMFPEFHPEDSIKFVNLLEDSRVESLRMLVRRAAAGEEEFDAEFVTRTLREVLKIERDIAAKRNVVGWLSQPLGFIPWVGSFLQKAAEVGSGRLIETRFKKDMDWFFLVSSV